MGTFVFDIDGTITAAPQQFAQIMMALKDAGHTVLVMTGQTTPITDADYEFRRKQLLHYEITDAFHDGILIAGPPDWVQHKQDMCREHEVDFVFENDKAYARSMSAVCPVTVMWEGT